MLMRLILNYYELASRALSTSLSGFRTSSGIRFALKIGPRHSVEPITVRSGDFMATIKLVGLSFSSILIPTCALRLRFGIRSAYSEETGTSKYRLQPSAVWLGDF